MEDPIDELLGAILLTLRIILIFVILVAVVDFAYNRGIHA